MFEVRVEPAQDGTVVVRVVGEVDLTVSVQLERALLTVPTAPGVHRLVVDLEHLYFLDSSGIHALVKGYLATRDAGLTYLVRNATGMVARVLYVTGVAEAFGMSDGAGEYPKGA